MSDAADVSGEAKRLVENYQKALEFLDGCPEPITVEGLQEAWRISEAGMDEDAIAEQYRATVKREGIQGIKELRLTLRETLTQGIETFQQVISEIGEGS